MQTGEPQLQPQRHPTDLPQGSVVRKDVFVRWAVVSPVVSDEVRPATPVAVVRFPARRKDASRNMCNLHGKGRTRTDLDPS